MLDVAGVPAGDARRFTAVGELLHRIGPGGVQQAIACRGAIRPRRNQRLGDELLQRLHDAIGRLALLARDRSRALQRERSGEDGETTKNDPLALADQTIAPVQRRTERLMPRRRRPSSAPLQLQPAVEQRRDLPQSVRADPHGGEFDRQRDAVELAANLGKNICVIVGNIRTMTGRGGSFRKQARRGIAQHLACAQPALPAAVPAAGTSSKICSPSTSSDSRLVARMLTPGAC